MPRATTATKPPTQPTAQQPDETTTLPDPEREQLAIDIVFDDTREPNEFLDALRERYAQYGSFTVRQVEAVLGNNNPGRHVGDVGDAVTVKGEVVYVSDAAPVTSAFGKDQFRFFVIVKSDDEDIVTFNLYRAFNSAGLTKGQSVKVNGEVREHQEYRGQARTGLKKVKVTQR